MMNCNCPGPCALHQRPTYNSRNSVDAFTQEAIRRGRALYRPDKSGTLVLELSEPAPASATALLTEHRPAESKQYQVQLQRGQRASRILPAGGYSVVATAPGFKPHRTYVEVVSNDQTGLRVHFDEPPQKPLSFAERLGSYGLKAEPGTLRNLTVEDGATVTLTPSSKAFVLDMRVLNITNIDDAKKILGHSDEYWPGERPRYGQVVEPEPSNLADTPDESNLLLDARFAIREYVYGNSQTVSGWKPYLNNWLSASAIPFPIFLYEDVTVGAHCLLNIGSAGLFCNRLRVHYTGRVKVTGSGPTVIEVSTYEQFGFLEVVSTVAFVDF
jgi:hypothetical protein